MSGSSCCQTLTQVVLLYDARSVCLCEANLASCHTARTLAYLHIHINRVCLSRFLTEGHSVCVAISINTDDPLPAPSKNKKIKNQFVSYSKACASVIMYFAEYYCSMCICAISRRAGQRKTFLFLERHRFPPPSSTLIIKQGASYRSK